MDERKRTHANGRVFTMHTTIVIVSSLDNINIDDYFVNTSNGLTDDDTYLIVPMIDARRMEVYTASFNSKGEAISKTEAVILNEDSFKEELEKGKVLFTGNGAEKFKTLVNHPNAIFAEQLPHATGMRVIAAECLNKKEFKDAAYFEPFYLKDFVAGKPKKLL